jgi:hypothetical protein
MKRVLTSPINDQSGSVLVIVTLVLMAVSVLGIMAIRTSTTELDVATNDKCYKTVFFAADGACDMTTELVGQNIVERGFSASSYGKTNVNSSSLDFFSNEEDELTPANNVPTKDNYDVEVPDLGGNRVHLKVYGNTRLSTGSALQIAAGYDGMGKGLAGGGAQIVYEIRSRATGPCNGLARVWWRWLQLI